MKLWFWLVPVLGCSSVTKPAQMGPRLECHKQTSGKQVCVVPTGACQQIGQLTVCSVSEVKQDDSVK